ncbi:MAG: arylsulfatase [Planctomycetota bacterium]|nr:arylsulfatase [Planctomycetota bacterium]
MPWKDCTRVAGVAAMVWYFSAVCTWAVERPNVVVIYTDDQGYGDASCLNPDSKFQTPNIDRLAREGIVFTDGHCSDTVCTPSRYGLLTGRYSWRTELKRGVFGAEHACLIRDGRMTLASLLGYHGYATAMVGKWHLGMDFPGDHGNRDWSQPVLDMPLDRGFDYFWGIPASMNYGVLAWFEGRFAKVPPTLYTRKKPNGLALADYRIMPDYERKALKRDDLEVAPDFVDSECLTRFTDRAIDWVKQQAAGDGKAKPFFLYLPYTSPHKPVIPLEQFRGKSKAGAYGDFMMETDWHIGRLLDELDRLKLTDDTLVFLSSDNGPETTWKQRIELYDHHSAGPYREGKRSIYEGGHRVPFIVRWPRQVKAGQVRDQPVCQTDLLATLAEMLGQELPANAAEDSVSFYQALTRTAPVGARAPMIHHASNGRFAIREGKWKLVMEHGRDDRELYDLNSDPGETRNVIRNNAALAAELTSRISSIVRNGRTTPSRSVPNDTPFWSDLTWMIKE